MKKRFVPSHYYKKVHQKLYKLTLGSKSVEDYHTEMEMLIKVVWEGGLNRAVTEIQNFKICIKQLSQLPQAKRKENKACVK